MQLVESVEILRFSPGSRCLVSVHVRCVDTSRRSSAGLLATHDGVNGGGYPVVLMHLLVLGAFWRSKFGCKGESCPVLMHLLVLGAFWLLPLGVALLRQFRGLERHRLRKHPAGPAGTALI